MARTYVILIRGIGPDSHKLVTMKELEKLTSDLGAVKSILATGNFVVRTEKSANEVARTFEENMKSRGLTRPLIVRIPRDLEAAVAANPFSAAVKARPAQVQVCFLEKPITKSGIVALESRAAGEVITTAAGELVIDYANGISGSRLTPDYIEKCAGSVGTSRNWNTVLKIVAQVS